MGWKYMQLVALATWVGWWRMVALSCEVLEEWSLDYERN